MLAKAHRITDARDYSAVVRRGVRRGSESSVVYALATEPEAPARFGFIVSKAVGGAVDRNLVKRRLRASAAERIRSGLAGVDVVVRALPPARSTPFDVLDEQLRVGIARAGAAR